VGLALLAAAAVSSALVALSATLIGLCWAGIVAYTFLVSVSTVAAAFAGGASLFFAGSCAMCGFAILSVAGYVYVAQAVYRRLKTSTATYYEW